MGVRRGCGTPLTVGCGVGLAGGVNVGPGLGRHEGAAYGVLVATGIGADEMIERF